MKYNFNQFSVWQKPQKWLFKPVLTTLNNWIMFWTKHFKTSNEWTAQKRYVQIRRSHFFRFERVSMLVISLKLFKPSGNDYASSLSCPSSVYNCWASILCWSPSSLTFPMMLGAPKLLSVGPPTLSSAYWSCWFYGGIMLSMAGSSCFCSSVCCLNSSNVPKRLIFRLLRSWDTFLELALSKWIVLPLLSTYRTKSHQLNSHKYQPFFLYNSTYMRWTAEHAAHSTSRQWPLCATVDFVRS